MHLSLPAACRAPPAASTPLAAGWGLGCPCCRWPPPSSTWWLFRQGPPSNQVISRIWVALASSAVYLVVVQAGAAPFSDPTKAMHSLFLSFKSSAFCAHAFPCVTFWCQGLSAPVRHHRRCPATQLPRQYPGVRCSGSCCVRSAPSSTFPCAPHLYADITLHAHTTHILTPTGTLT